MAIPTHAGTETQPPASRPVWRSASNSRRDPSAKHPNRNAWQARMKQSNAACDGVTPPSPVATPPLSGEAERSAARPPRAQTPVPELQPAKRSPSPAHNSLSHKAEYHFFAPARPNAVSGSRTMSHRDGAYSRRTSLHSPCPAGPEKAPYIKGRHSDLTRGRREQDDIHIPPVKPL